MPNDNTKTASEVVAAENKSKAAEQSPGRETRAAVGTASPQKKDDVDEDEAVLLERMRGDAVGDTMFSSKFVLQTLVQLSELKGVLDKKLEDDLCKLWDMSVTPEVVTLLLKNDAIELLMYQVEISEDVRLYEILIGLLGNMCAQVECVEQLTASVDWLETLLRLNTCMDKCMLLQLMRVYQYIMAHVKSGKEQLGLDWYACFAACDNAAKNLGLMLQQSVNDELLTAGLKATNAVLASCALVEEENTDSEDIKLKPFAQVFLVEELWNGVNTAFIRLMRDDLAKQADEINGDGDGDGDGVQVATAEDAEQDADVGYEAATSTSLISCDLEVIQTYLNICTILAQLPEAQASVELYAPNIMRCLSRILLFLQQPMQLFPLDERQEEYLEDLTHICGCLQYFFEKEAFINLLGVWLKLSKHIEEYTEADTTTDFEADEDAPRAQYVDNASKLLRLLANMLLKAEEHTSIEELQEVSKQQLETFTAALNAEQDELFQKAQERMSQVLDKAATGQA